MRSGDGPQAWLALARAGRICTILTKPSGISWPGPCCWQAWRSAASAVNDELSPVRATVLPAPQAGSLAAKTGSAAALLVSCSFGVQRLEAEVAALTRGDEAAIVEDQMQVSAPLQLLLLPTLHLSTLANRHSFIFCWLLIPARHALLVIFPGLAAGGAGQAGPTLGAPAAEPGLHS